METRTEPTPSRRRARSPRGKGALLRDDIVRSAAELLDETSDASAITLRAVARRAGISAPSIYPHFSDRESILLAVVQEEFELLQRHLREAVDEAGSDAVSRLLALCLAYLDYASTHPERYLVMFGGIWDARPAMDDAVVARRDVEELGQTTLAELAGLLQACVDEGSSTSTDPATDATTLWVAMHGLAHQRIVSTAITWPEGVDTRLIRRLAYL